MWRCDKQHFRTDIPMFQVYEPLVLLLFSFASLIWAKYYLQNEIICSLLSLCIPKSFVQTDSQMDRQEQA